MSLYVKSFYVCLNSCFFITAWLSTHHDVSMWAGAGLYLCAYSWQALPCMSHASHLIHLHCFYIIATTLCPHKQPNRIMGFSKKATSNSFTCIGREKTKTSVLFVFHIREKEVISTCIKDTGSRQKKFVGSTLQSKLMHKYCYVLVYAVTQCWQGSPETSLHSLSPSTAPCTPFSMWRNRSFDGLVLPFYSCNFRNPSFWGMRN